MAVISSSIAEPPSSYSYLAPSLSYGAPSVSHSAPSISYGAPSISHSGSSVSYVAPSISHSAPSISYAAPSVSYAAPSISHSAPSISYGVPTSSHGWSQPQAVHTDYWQKDVGHQTSEGLHLDSNLLHKIEDILIAHENSENSNKVYSAPSHSYGAPQATYGVPHWSSAPSHHGWSSKVVGIDFGHLRQSIQVAQLLGKDRYAPAHVSSSHGSSSNSHSSSGWNVETTGWKLPSVSSSHGWAQSSGWVEAPKQHVQVISTPVWSVAPAKIPSGWSVAKPSSKYGVPRW